MSRYYGIVGYATSEEKVIDGISTGVWEDKIVEKPYYGDVLRNRSRWETNGRQNDDLNVSNRISILADQYAWDNFSKIKYAEFMGERWKVVNAEVERPRLVLSLGGVWNGKTSD